ncbi:pyridoxamine 5'-phosphate oxidase [Longispora albida]|uniref:pyridoxamine 5'-phosphate oxidase n=1 Tax=Longispora albida TaxID=203523 RepID=UPI00035F082F|nr:pyridoxamine 5'-phosphate oxidase [Longispora albida]
MRQEYGDLPLDEADLAADWTAQFAGWLEIARLTVAEPNAMVLATASADGRPSARSVLLKSFDARGLVFFTNYQSRKGQELAGNPNASLVFPWYEVHRQVVVCGRAERVTRAETAEYFAERPVGARLGAWASKQSAVLTGGRAELVTEWEAAADRYGEEVPVPDHWGGYRIVPETVEFWQGRRSRLHDRLRYRHSAAGWIVERLSP